MPITLDGTLGVGTPGITLAGGAITANAAQLNSSAEDVNAENRIINGDMGIWQRAVSGVLNGYTAADRWLNNHVGGTVTQSQQSFTLGDTLGIAQPRFSLRQNVTGQTLPAQYAQVQQRIEDVRSYAGQTITILGWARRSSGATGNMAVEVSQFFGTGGGASIEVLLAPVTVTLGVSWAPFAVTIAVPSLTGKTIGTSASDCLALRFWISAGSDWSSRTNSIGLQNIAVDFWGVHIRVGTWTAADAALYRPRDPGTELALCQRFYCTAYANNRFAASGGSQLSDVSVYWPVTMRAAVPFVTFVSGSAPTNGTVSINNPTSSMFRHGLISTAAGDTYHIFALYSADAEL